MVRSKKVRIKATKSLGVSDSFAFVFFAGGLILWAVIPTLRGRVVAMLIAVLSLVYVAYKSAWTDTWPMWRRHVVAALVSVLLGVPGSLLLRSQARAEESKPVPKPSPIDQSQQELDAMISKLGAERRKNFPSESLQTSACAVDEQLRSVGVNTRVGFQQHPGGPGIIFDHVFNSSIVKVYGSGGEAGIVFKDSAGNVIEDVHGNTIPTPPPVSCPQDEAPK